MFLHEVFEVVVFRVVEHIVQANGGARAKCNLRQYVPLCSKELDGIKKSCRMC